MGPMFRVKFGVHPNARILPGSINVPGKIWGLGHTIGTKGAEGSGKIGRQDADMYRIQTCTG